MPGETASALRLLGMTCLAQGDFAQAQTHLEEALRLYDPDRDREAKFRYGTDAGASGAIYLARTVWALGDVVRARQLSEIALARAEASNHVPTLVQVHSFNAGLEIVRGNFAAVRRAADVLAGLSREHGTTRYLNLAGVFGAWARAWLGEREAGTTDFHRAVAAFTDAGSKLGVPFYEGLLAELEAKGEGIEGALSQIDMALALAQETGERWTDAFLHRVRGEILLKRDPANTVPAEEAFLAAIAIAEQQKARAFGLRAALFLARLYQSTGRAADAYAVLTPALAGFSPTPEFPEIEQAQALLAALTAQG